jgi:WD40-like Beta Propeller Repeat
VLARSPGELALFWRLPRELAVLRHRPDDLNQLLAAVALLAGEFQELLGAGNNGALFPRAGDGDPTTAAEFEQPFVTQQAKSTEDGVSVHTKHCCEVPRRRQALARQRLTLGDRASQLGSDLIVEAERLAAVNLDLEHGARDTSFIDPTIVDASKPRRRRLVGPPWPHPAREWLTALIKEARQRARRRRLRIAAGLFAAAIAALGVASGGLFTNGGGRATGARQPSLPARETAASGPVANGPLTLIANNHVPYDDEQIAAVGAFGATGPVFHCSTTKGCYELTGFAWSPNGRWLAFGVDTVSIASDYNGLHLYNLATKRDIHLATGHFFDLSWSRDGSKLAYLSAFPERPGEIHIQDLTAPEPAKLLQTGNVGEDASPSWSPDGRHIAFATKSADGHWSVSSIAIDRSNRRVLARGGSPAWSPDGRLIAYRGRCGRIRLMTPDGRPVLSPHAGHGTCEEIGVGGAPVWSPDGRQIAMATRSGTYVMDRAGGHLHLVTPETGLGTWRTGLPAWQPLPKR